MWLKIYGNLTYWGTEVLPNGLTEDILSIDTAEILIQKRLNVLKHQTVSQNRQNTIKNHEIRII